MSHDSGQVIDSQFAGQFDRLPPHSIEAEQCLLGSMMIFGGPSAERRLAFAKIRQMVSRDAFYQADHQIMFEVMCNLEERNRPVDVIILRQELIARSLYEEVGGKEYLTTVMSTVPSWAHWEHYARIVACMFKLREILSISAEMQRACYAPHRTEEGPDDISAKALTRLVRVQTTGRVEQSIMIGDAANDFMEKQGSKGAEFIPTGFDMLDAVIGGFEPGRFLMIGGRPGSGKSQVLKKMLMNVAMRGEPVGLITIEESQRKIAINMLAQASGVANNKIKQGRTTEEEWAEVEFAAAKLQGVPFWIHDAALSIQQVTSQMNILAVEKKCRVIGIDYLQLIEPENDREGNMAQQIGAISKAVKMAAKQLNVQAAAAVQLTRIEPPKGKQLVPRKPDITDLRGSGSLEQDGDVIILLHREDYYKVGKIRGYKPNHLLECYVAKNKDNSPGMVRMYFDGAHQDIREWTEMDTATAAACEQINAESQQEQDGEPAQEQPDDPIDMPFGGTQ